MWSRRGLTACPALETEDQLRLLNLQHNAIRRVENVDHLRRLIFLDLYDNQLEQIDGLTALRSLRVLMLGKNRSVSALVPRRARLQLLVIFIHHEWLHIIGLQSGPS